MISCEEYFKTKKDMVKNKIKEDKLDINLAIVQVGDNPASNRYIKMKLRDCEEVGINVSLCKCNENIKENKLRQLVSSVANTVDAIIVQLPLPKHINPRRVADSIPKEKDIDGFRIDSPFGSCTPLGIISYLECNRFYLDGKNAVIIGRSNIVGKPMAEMLLAENCTVTVCHSHTKDLPLYTRNADLIVVAAGQRNILTEDMISDSRKPIVIDVGINIDENGHLHGDCDYENIVGKCELITPVPKGVGLLTRSALLDNCLVASQDN